jgi:type IV pilus assembly protein PilX
MRRARERRQYLLAPRALQRGAALMIGLVILVLITLLAVLVARLATLQERAAGAHRSNDMSAQQAQGALAVAERWLATRTPGSLCPDATGPGVYWHADDLRVIAFADRERWPTDGVEAAVQTAGSTVAARAPRFVIEAVAFVPDVADDPDIAAMPLAERFACAATAPDGVGYFRITARGTGGEAFIDDAPVASSVVQSVFAVRLRGAMPHPPPRRVAWRALE